MKPSVIFVVVALVLWIINSGRIWAIRSALVGS